jgi:hypothetical protein
MQTVSRFRLVIATFVAVAMMSFGAAACTPEQQVQAGRDFAQGVSGLIGFSLLYLFEQLLPPCNGCEGGGTPVP